MNRMFNLLAGLLLACLLAVPLLADTGAIAHGWQLPSLVLLMLVGIGFLIFGAVTVTYEYPVQSTVAPTVSQMKPLSLVTAQIVWGADSDTLALITHNMQLGTIALPTNPGSLVNETSCLFPLVSWYYVLGGSNTAVFNGSILSSSVFQLTKTNAASSAGTMNIFVLRPWTGLR